MRRWTGLLLGAGMLGSCQDLGASCSRNARPPPELLITRVALPDPVLRGMSGLTRAPSGRPYDYLAVAERLHHLIPIRVHEGTFEALAPLPIRGVEASIDLEGVASLEDGRLAFSTEEDRSRDVDYVMLAELHDDHAEVVRRIALPYETWGLRPERNRGLEGLCGSSGRIVVASEMVVESPDGSRRSPVAVLDLATERWTPGSIRLTSDTGKISGLACSDAAGGLTVTAIERHFDRLHLVQFDVGDDGQVSGARLLADLRPRFSETPPNFEGIERIGDNAFLLVTDNDWRGVRGPTELIRWDAPHPGSRRGPAPAGAP
ncbi:MAG: esterase-like activity of phytase family protein [Myxococcales bacterium]|nr:esterase-like activity of phytase family protein [Myxococcales bacterium]